MPIAVSPAFLLLVGLAALAGAVGGMAAGRSPGILLSALLGVVGGLALGGVARAYQLPPLVELAGFSAVYTAGGAALFALAVGLSSGRR